MARSFPLACLVFAAHILSSRAVYNVARDYAGDSFFDLFDYYGNTGEFRIPVLLTYGSSLVPLPCTDNASPSSQSFSHISLLIALSLPADHGRKRVLPRRDRRYRPSPDLCQHVGDSHRQGGQCHHSRRGRNQELGASFFAGLGLAQSAPAGARFAERWRRRYGSPRRIRTLSEACSLSTLSTFLSAAV